MSSIKVLHIGSGNLYGGIEKFLLTLGRSGKHFPRLEQHFAICFPGQLHRDLRDAEIPVYLLREMRARKPATILENRRILRRLENRLGVDAIIYHSLWSFDLLAVGALRREPAQVLWMHDAFHGSGAFEWFARLRKPDLLLSNSRYTASTARLLYPKAKPRTIYCPVEFRPPMLNEESRAALRLSLETRKEDVVIVQSSRLEPWKGHQQHLIALSQLRDLSGWVLWIAGGAQRPEEQLYLDGLKEQADTLGLTPRIRFLGQRNDIPALLESADIHCQPNLRPEPFGIAFVEAMMARLPIATFRSGSVPELIDESCGRVAEPGDVVGLAGILRSLITDRSLRERLGQNGPDRAREISDPERRLSDLWSILNDELLQRPRYRA